MKEIVIFGTGSFAEIIYLYLNKSANAKVVAFTIHSEFIKGDKTYYGLPVISFEEIQDEYPPDKYEMFIAIGYTDMNKKRTKIFKDAKLKGYSLFSYIHPSSHIGDNFTMGENCFIFERNVIQPFVTLGDNVIIWTGNVISHHTIIKNNCFIVSHVAIAGNVVIEPFCFIGMNATIRNGVTIASECVIGAGSVILKNTNKKEVYTTKSTIKLDITSDKLRNL